MFTKTEPRKNVGIFLIYLRVVISTQYLSYILSAFENLYITYFLSFYSGYLIYDIERIHLKLELKMPKNPTIY